MLVFFETTDFVVSNVVSLEFFWESHIGESGVRPYHSLSYRVKGDAVFTSDGETVETKTDEIIFVPKGSRYQIKTGNERLFVVHFLTDKPIGTKIKTFCPQQHHSFKRYFEDLNAAYCEKAEGYESECKSLLYRIIADMEREISAKQGFQENDALAKALKYIHRHYRAESINVHELAESCFMSETYFRKIFSARYGCSPLSYINRLRAEHAIELLGTGYFTVTQVSQMCGFSSPYYFSAFIKKETGRAPSVYLHGLEEN